MGNEWHHGLLGCFNNCRLCVITYFLPCVIVGQIAELLILGKKICRRYTCLALVPIVNIIVRYRQRSKIRYLQDIDGSCCGDIICILFCPFCSLVQEAQELKHMQCEGIAIHRE